MNAAAMAIGWIGLGNMGRPMVANVAARGGYSPVCFDAAGTSSRLPDGCRAAESVAEIAAASDNTATTDKFPNRVLPGTFDAGFYTAHMAKDVTLFLAEAHRLRTSVDVAEAVTATWRAADAEQPGSDFSEIWTHVRGLPR